MKCIYFVTEGITDQVVIEGLVAQWLGTEDFISRHIQPPSSAYADGLNSNLSEGWKGVLAWCNGMRPEGSAGKDEAIELADCLIVHTDADVATDPEFRTPPFSGACPPAANAANWVRDKLATTLGGIIPSNVVLCVPAQDLEAWVLSSLHPDIADQNLPIECRAAPATLLIQRPPHRLVRRKNGQLKKITAKYQTSQSLIAKNWSYCTSRCVEAMRFEQEAKLVLGV